MSITYFEINSKHCFRVVSDGKTIYSLNIWPDEIPDSPRINFYGVKGGTTGFNQNAINARAKISWDKEMGEAILELDNLSLLPKFGEYKFTFDAFIDVLWDGVCCLLEAQGT